ncbi:MAG: prephenate dehydrogenase/arogenate dehydrogenase family protein [Chloroflexi bacterium]|nr:MAG: prephenate dehydrogenase/arogenate dehydrogenase family protein [Phototrophicales bacterium]RMF78401.1 MAG: prephenate dehydrogenase/arogenate dehydrogenase family protein [Chloroflexota bacterium]
MTPGGFTARHLAVVGLGLMGGSMALALRPHVDFVTGIDPDDETREYALTHGIVDVVTDDLREGVAEADVVVLAAPVRAIVTMIKKRIGSYLRSNTLLLDVGSTKQDICEAMGALPIGIHAIGCHPMTGKERSGITTSDPDLYKGRPFVLCPTRRTTPATRLRTLALVEALEAVPLEMDAERHDKLVAGISHLPYLLSAALVATVTKQANEDEALWQVAAGGFRDMSRLAGSDVRMMSDILSTNTQAVATLLALFRVQLANLEALLISQDEEHLIDFLTPTREARLKWIENYERDGK